MTKICLICCSKWILLISKILCFCTWNTNNPTNGSFVLFYPKINDQISQIQHNTHTASSHWASVSLVRVFSFQPSSWSQRSSLVKGVCVHQWNHLLCVWKQWKPAHTHTQTHLRPPLQIHVVLSLVTWGSESEGRSGMKGVKDLTDKYFSEEELL